MLFEKLCARCRMPQRYDREKHVHQPCAYCDGCLCDNWCALSPALQQELLDSALAHGVTPEPGLLVDKTTGERRPWPPVATGATGATGATEQASETPEQPTAAPATAVR